MPLRSVEAATRDDAIAAAREQFGPSARVVGVRRVRSGGVLGFFATERYIAEVAPDPRPPVPGLSPGRAEDTPFAEVFPGDFSSPLASAAPARARTAPARNGASAWAAEAARATDVPAASPALPSWAAAARVPEPPRPAVATWSPSSHQSASHQPSSHRSAWSPPVKPVKPDEDRVSELAALLTAQQAEPAAAPAYSRASLPRAASTPWGRDATSVAEARDDDAPSPFTAALARMVAGDRDVQLAVREALEGPTATPWPVGPGFIGSTDSAVPPVARQEEETVSEQVFAPSPNMAEPAELPSWAAEPEAPSASGTPREEAIAEVLRTALAQGHSDEALTGILRKVLDGASPQTALADPVMGSPGVLLEAMLADHAPAPASVFEAPVYEAPVYEAPAAESPVFEAPAAESPVSEAPTAESPVSEAPTAESPVSEAPTAESPAFEAPAVESPFESQVETPAAEVWAAPDAADEAPVVAQPPVGISVFAPVVDAAPPAEVARPRPRPRFESMWGGTPAPTPLWGEPAPASSAWNPLVGSPIWGQPSPAPLTSDAPIWAEFAAAEAPAEATATDDEAPAVAAEAEAEAEAEEIVASSEEAVVDAEFVFESAVDAAVDAVGEAVEESVEGELAEAEATEAAPLLARTASDPAPMMSLDSTTIMPPLSLLPPLPSSRTRGRGRPPVPRSSRPTVPSASPPAAPSEGIEKAERTERTDDLSAGSTEGTAVQATMAGETDTTAAEQRPALGSQPGAAPVSWSLATVTRLPVGPLMAGLYVPEVAVDAVDPDGLFCPVSAPATATPAPATPAPATSAPVAPGVGARLVQLGMPRDLLGPSFDGDVAELGVYAALTRSLSLSLPEAPQVPTGPGETLFVAGPGVDALRAARSLAASLHLDPDRVQWATRGDLAGLAPSASRITTVETAIERRQDALAAGSVTIVAVDAPLRTDAYWTAQMVAVWNPVAVWGVVEATRKAEDLQPWIDGLPQLDALIVQDTDLSADPAAVLRRAGTPVAVVDGARATPHRWASLLCERLESAQA